MSDLYLVAQDDSLPMRKSHSYAKDKLRILEGYINRFIVTMPHKKWRALFYIDLMAGPGKNRFENGDIMLGSPLISLTARRPFTHYRFIDLAEENCQALRTRTAASDKNEKVKIMQGDCNLLIDEIVAEIKDLNSVYRQGVYPCLNLAFIDPEGLELHWSTVEKLGSLRTDMIINFSTSGFTRNVNQKISSGETALFDNYFGTSEWKSVYDKVADKDSTHVRRAMLDFYKQRLAALEYRIHPEEKEVRNSKNMQIYTLIFASKHDLGDKFWSGAIQGVSQPKLL